LIQAIKIKLSLSVEEQRSLDGQSKILNCVMVKPKNDMSIILEENFLKILSAQLPRRHSQIL
jgi:hypothetical protein